MTVYVDGKDWYKLALRSLLDARDATIIVPGDKGRILARHLPMMAVPDPGFTVSNAFNMIRFRKLHRLFFVAVGMGLGIGIDRFDGEELVVRMNGNIGRAPAEPGQTIIRSATHM